VSHCVRTKDQDVEVRTDIEEYRLLEEQDTRKDLAEAATH